MQGRSVLEVQMRIEYFSPFGKKYWAKVLTILEDKKIKRKLH